MSNKPLMPWPSDRLEVVDKCPLCTSPNKRILESSLVDWMSDPPTGFWEMMVCTDCGAAYLTPRPVLESIKDAYSKYHTHTSEKDDLVHTRLRSIKDYIAKRYYTVTSKSGSFIDYIVYITIRMLFPVSLYFDAKSRHIFKVQGKPGRLLDIGCGNGEFLRFASGFGWTVVGVDVDEHAVFEARSNGLDVRSGSIDAIESNEKFDFISLSHVIEHVHDPIALIQRCYTLLNDGGTLWMETPNIESFGYAVYKSVWRGLEPPRHLILFNQSSLNELLSRSGFVSIRQKLHSLSGIYMALSSEKLLNTSSSCGSWAGCITRKMLKFFRVIMLEAAQMYKRKRREWITLVAIR
jgi:2-polyprenyl-3-methyl-5-hydroxy-6-metoxy-1,4-benzoquinol methylase